MGQENFLASAETYTSTGNTAASGSEEVARMEVSRVFSPELRVFPVLSLMRCSQDRHYCEHFKSSEHSVEDWAANAGRRLSIQISFSRYRSMVSRDSDLEVEFFNSKGPMSPFRSLSELERQLGAQEIVTF